MEIWNKLDEVIGSGFLSSIAIIAMLIGYDSGVTQMCVTGIVALLATKIAKGGITNG